MNMIAPRRCRLVLIGNGMAGVRALEEILQRAPGEFDVTVFGAEPHGNYNRIMLSPVLAGEKSFAEISTSFTCDGRCQDRLPPNRGSASKHLCLYNLLTKTHHLQPTNKGSPEHSYAHASLQSAFSRRGI